MHLCPNYDDVILILIFINGKFSKIRFTEWVGCYC